MPTFSVLLPTRNRSEIVGGAIESILKQTYGDLELVISDNDQSPEATCEAVKKFSDPRIRYHRTSGKLSMHDNWENAYNLSTGDYLVLVEDKMRLVSNALAILKSYLDRFGSIPISYDIKFARQPTISDPGGIPPASLCSSREAIEMFCQFKQRFFNILPKGLDSCVPRQVFERIKQNSPTGYVFSYISPDYASGFMVLAQVDQFVHTDAPLVYIPNNWMWEGKYSNGQASYRKTDGYKNFLATLPVSREEIIKAVPIKSEFLWINSVVYDFLNLYRKPGHSPSIDWVSYHAFCYYLILLGRRMGGNLDFELAEFKRSMRERSLPFRMKTWVRFFQHILSMAFLAFRNRLT